MKNSDIGIFHKEKKKKERSKNAEAKDPSSLTVKKIERVTINGNTIPARYGRKIYNRREKIMNAITDVAQQVLIGLLSAVGAGFALWGAIDVATGFSQHNAAKQEAGIPKVIGGVAVIAIANLLIPKIFEFLTFT